MSRPLPLALLEALQTAPQALPAAPQLPVSSELVVCDPQLDPLFDPALDVRAKHLGALRQQRGALAGLQAEFRSRSTLTPRCADTLELQKEVLGAQQELALRERELASAFVPQHSPEQLISPSMFFVSRLFNARSKTVQREELLKVELGSTKEGVVTYAGPELRQSEGFVFMALLNLARDIRVGRKVGFTAKDLAESLYGAYNGDTRSRLKQSIYRLQHAVVQFPTFSVQLVGKFEYPNRGPWAVTLDPDLVSMFHQTGAIWLSVHVRRALPEGLATWLYGYVESQTRLIPTRVSELHRLCGSECKPEAFGKILSRALTRLAEAKLIEPGWSLRSDTVHWMKTAQ